MPLVLHICARCEAAQVFGDLKLADFPQRARIHVKFSASDHEYRGRGAELHQLKVVRQHLRVSLLVERVNVVGGLVEHLGDSGLLAARVESEHVK
jgi:hypothetical protein